MYFPNFSHYTDVGEQNLRMYLRKREKSSLFHEKMGERAFEREKGKIKDIERGREENVRELFRFFRVWHT